MAAVIDLAGARRRRQTRPAALPCAGSANTATPSDGLRASYQRLAPAGMPETMSQSLRDWLSCWALRRGVDEVCVQRFVAAHAAGLSATIDAAQHDAAAVALLAPELLLALVGLDRDPDALRAAWPGDRRELDALADVFGRPFTG